jgi:hypothetical protein
MEIKMTNIFADSSYTFGAYETLTNELKFIDGILYQKIRVQTHNLNGIITGEDYRWDKVEGQ